VALPSSEIKFRKARALVLVLVAGVLPGACGGPAQAPVVTEATHAPTKTGTAPPSETPKPSDTPEPTATATEPALQLEVLEWHRWPDAREPNMGWGYVNALVRNPYDFPVEVTGSPTARLLDEAGAFVIRSLGADVLDGSLMGIGQIRPGEAVGLYFCACGTVGSMVVPEWESFELDFDLREAQPVEVTTDFQLAPHRIFVQEAYNFFSVAFNGRYTGSEPLRAIAVRMTVRGPNGEYLGSGEVGILGDRTTSGFDRILPGDIFDYTVSVPMEPSLLSEALDYELFAVGSLAEP
jgi:hypothetical protein